MANFTTACCYLPSTIALVDDNANFLDNLQAGLSSFFNSNCFTHVPAVKDFFETKPFSFEAITQRALSDVESDHPDTSSLQLNLRNLYQEIYNPKRFERVGLIVMDYAMPGLSGEMLSKVLKAQNDLIKTLMLTGEANKEHAVDFFNRQIIDLFVRKDEPDLIETVLNGLKLLQQKLFIELTKGLFYRVKNPPACLQDDVFSEYFQTFVQQHEIIEYYLLDDRGSFLLLDAEANPTWLAVCTDQDVQNFYDIAKDYGDAPEAVLSALTSRSHIPFFFSDDDYNTAPKDWGRYLHTAKKLDGQQQAFYVADIHGSDLYVLDRERIVSYSDCLVKDPV